MYTWPVSIITEICCCGAEFKAQGMDSNFCRDRYQQFLDAHAICREPEKQDPEKEELLDALENGEILDSDMAETY